MKRYWSADFHFGHQNILRYSNRPFRDVEHMGARLIAEANQRAKPGDLLVHVGDFCCRGNEKGVAGSKLPWTHYAEQFVSDLVLLEGNHDRQNHIKTVGQHLFGRIGPYKFFASHLPTDNENQDPVLMDYVRRTCHFAIVGHVHDRWRTTWRDGIFNINVGVDANDCRPVSDDELIVLYQMEPEEKRGIK